MQQTLAVGWFPSDQWEVAVDRWPSLAEEMPRDHTAYRAAIQARMKDIAPRTVGARLVMVELTVAEIDERAAAEGLDADSTELRGRTASALAQQGHGTPWPPARNDPCWCGSAKKYKFCCDQLVAPPAPAPPAPAPG